MIAIRLLLGAVMLVTLIDCYIVDPGPLVIATKGEVWPKPQHQEKYDGYFVVRPQLFEFQVVTSNECSLLQDAFSRYHRILTDHHQRGRQNFKFQKHLEHKTERLNDDLYNGFLDSLSVSLNGRCVDDEYPSFSMNEEYQLNITAQGAQLSANSTWGVLRGLETFSQLMYLGEDTISLQINLTNISDFPRFSHRGLLIDTSRHYIPVDKILVTLDAMAYNKMNVFHWHITDDQSFPYVSKKFPDLSVQGAYANFMVYTPADVQEIIEYARVRGIRTLPEFDTPGHTRSWGEAKRELLTECYNNGTKTGKLGPIDPTKNVTYEFLKELFEEVGTVFPDQYVHLGGDEVGFECWKSNPEINEFMKDNNITDNYVSLESYYIQKLINIVNQLNSSSIVWEEVFVNGVVLPNETIVHVWRDTWELTIFAVTLTGRSALLSSCWYLDHLNSDGDWQKYYNCDPYDFLGTERQKKLVLGGEACMWGEVVNEYNIISRVWPRASAAAEKLWSDRSANDIAEAARRLEEHTCRMNRRGVGAQPPNASGYCI